MKTEITTIDAVTKIATEMKSDPSYRIGWQANIAMSFCDAVTQFKKKNNKRQLSYKEIHECANNAANSFLNLLGRDIVG